MRRDLESCKAILEKENLTCVIRQSENIYKFTERGIKPFMGLLEAGTDLQGAAAADKVIGKAAALLMQKAKIAAVYAAVISEPACKVLKDAGIETEYGKLVARIHNRKGDGLCPMESAVLTITDADEAYRVLREKMQQMKHSRKL